MTCLPQVTQTSYMQQLSPCLDRMVSEIMKTEVHRLQFSVDPKYV